MVKSHLKSSPKGFQTFNPQLLDLTPEQQIEYYRLLEGLRGIAGSTADDDARWWFGTEVLWANHDGLEAFLEQDEAYQEALLLAQTKLYI